MKRSKGNRECIYIHSCQSTRLYMWSRDVHFRCSKLNAFKLIVIVDGQFSTRHMHGHLCNLSDNLTNFEIQRLDSILCYGVGFRKDSTLSYQKVTNAFGKAKNHRLARCQFWRTREEHDAGRAAQTGQFIYAATWLMRNLTTSTSCNRLLVVLDGAAQTSQLVPEVLERRETMWVPRIVFGRLKK